VVFTPISFELRPDGSNGAFDNPPLSIGADVQFIGELETDAPVSGGMAGIAGTLYAVLQTFQPVGNPPLPNAVPSGAFYALQITNATPVNTPVAMTFTGTNPQVNGTLTVEIDSTGTNYVFRFIGVFTMLEDLGPAPVWQNSRRLLFSVNGEVNPLVNTAPWVYSGTRELRLAIRHLAGTVWSATDLVRNRAARWYNAEPNAAPPTAVTNFSLALTIGGQPAMQVSSVEPTEATITFNSSNPQKRLLLGLIRTDAVNASATWFDAVAGGFAYLVNEPTSAFLPVHRGLPIFRGPATPIAPATPPTWTGSFVIDPANIVAGATYRLVAVVFYDPAGVDEDSYSFITNELPTLDVPSPCPPALNARIIDYRTQHPSILNGAACYERLRAETDWHGASYAACRAAKGFPETLQAAASSMRVRIYEQVGSNRRVYADQVAPKTNATTMAGGPLSATWDGARWSAGYDFRVRWEPNVPNLYDLDANGVVLAPTGNQNWAGKTLYIEWLFTLAHTSPQPYETTLEFKQRFSVASASDCFRFEFFDASGNPTSSLCAGSGNMTVCVNACFSFSGGDRVILAMLPENYALTSIREYESWTGELSQLQQGPVVFGDSTWDANGRACFVVDTNQLLNLTQYKAVIIVKPLVTPSGDPCEDCFQYVGLPLNNEELANLADCFLFDMRNNNLS